MNIGLMLRYALHRFIERHIAADDPWDKMANEAYERRQESKEGKSDAGQPFNERP